MEPERGASWRRAIALAITVLLVAGAITVVVAAIYVAFLNYVLS